MTRTDHYLFIYYLDAVSRRLFVD